MDIKNEIQILVSQLGNMRDEANSRNRDLTQREAAEMDEMMDRIEGLIALGERPGVPLTFYQDGPVENRNLNFSDDQYTRKNKMSNNGPFKTFGEQLGAIISADSPGGKVDSRLHEVRAASGLAETPASAGGFMVQESFGQAMLEAAFTTGVLGKLCMNFQMSTPQLKMPGLDESSRATGSRWGGVRSYWTDEASTAVASQPTFRQIELNARKMVVLTYLTNELIEDVELMQTYVQTVMAAEIGFQIDDGIINGLGGGQGFLGILNSGAVVEVAKEVGQAANTIVLENVIKAYSRLIPSAKKNSVFICNSDCLPALMTMSLGAGTGGTAAYLPAAGISGSPYGSLMGKSLIEVEQCSTVGTSGDLILAAFNPGYLLGTRGGTKSAISAHVRFLHDESVLKTTIRISGQPLISQPITGYKSADTYSHFVTIADRD
jgi:HK97 family phage major capsid protein